MSLCLPACLSTGQAGLQARSLCCCATVFSVALHKKTSQKSRSPRKRSLGSACMQFSVSLCACLSACMHACHRRSASACSSSFTRCSCPWWTLWPGSPGATRQAGRADRLTVGNGKEILNGHSNCRTCFPAPRTNLNCLEKDRSAIPLWM